jgi:hypothetical protein
MMKRLLGQKFFLNIFFTFERDTTKHRGTLLENVKKSKINPLYCSSPLQALI